MSDTLLSLELDNPFEECINRIFRIEGKCKQDSICNQQSCVQNYVVNITACNVDEACKKLKEKFGVTQTIKSIRVISTVDGKSCLSDEELLPLLTTCSECCDFLIDEDSEEIVTVESDLTYCFTTDIEVITESSFTTSYSVSGGTYVISPSIISVTTTSNDSIIITSYQSADPIVTTTSSQSTFATTYKFDTDIDNIIYLNNLIGIGGLTADPTVTVTNYTTISLNIPVSTDITVITSSSESSSISPSYSCTTNIIVETNLYSTSANSDVGEVVFIDNELDLELETDLVVFAIDEAPVLTTTIDYVISSDCPVQLLQILNLQHNLNSIPDFNFFLERNGFDLPGILKENTFIPLYYSSRFGFWKGNLHYSGVDGNLYPEDWDLFFLLENVEADENWQFSMNIKKQNNSGTDLARFWVAFSPSIFCAKDGFTRFDFSFDHVNFTSSPSSLYNVFRDESNFFGKSETNLLKFSLSQSDTKDNSLLQVSLEQQQIFIRSL